MKSNFSNKKEDRENFVRLLKLLEFSKNQDYKRNDLKNGEFLLQKILDFCIILS
jgi:hypothetical protein